MKHTSRGFSLIELIVVIAVIALISSVIAVTLSAARAKARDSAVKAGVSQMIRLMAFEFNLNGSYAALQSGWDYTAEDCADSFTGTHALNAREVCTNIVTNGGQVYTGNNDDLTTKFSVMAYLPGRGTYYCSGSSGRTSSSETGSGFTTAGCYANP